MKKLARTCLLAAVVCLLTVFAAAETTAYVIPELDMALEIPADMEILDKAAIDEITATEEFGDVLDLLVGGTELESATENMEVFLEFLEASEDGDFFFGVVGKQKAQDEGLSDMTEEDWNLLAKLYDAVLEEVEEPGMQCSAAHYRNEQLSFLQMTIQVTEAGETVWMDTYTTFYGGETYAMAFVTNMRSRKDTGRAVMETVRFDQSVYSATGFVDVKGHWAEATIEKVVDLGLFAGTSDTTFSPDGGMTRAMLVQVLYRMEDCPEAEPSAFTDVAEDAWYAEAVAWAAEQEIVLGSDGKFNPDGLLTREQLAAILWRYAQYCEVDVSVGENTNILSYTDALDVSEYAYPPLQWACGAGLMKGVDESHLAPQNTTTRAQVATILVRYLEQ